MREILFRGQDKRNNWHHGFYWSIENNYYIKEKGADCQVINETIGEYIGLVDDKNEKIFAGDILKVSIKFPFLERETYYAIVEFGNCNNGYTWGWCLNFDANEDFSLDPDILFWVETGTSDATCEIVGNIYDNKIEDFIGKE